jgi:Leucine-rich repeat (LRR) protein
MEIRAKIDGYWEVVGETPGTVFVPPCEDIELFLSGPFTQLYKLEVARLGARRLELRPETDNLKAPRQCGLLDGITSLTVRGYDYSIRDLSALAGLTDLTTLNLTPSCDLRDISGLAELPQLTSLSIGGCPHLQSLEPLAELKHLRHLQPSDSPTDEQIKWLEAQGILDRLTSLAVSHYGWTDLSALPQLPQLTALELVRCPMLDDLSALRSMPHLKSLSMNVRASDISPVAELTELNLLELRNCGYITNLPDLSDLRKLESLTLYACHGLHDLTPVSDLTSLRRLDLSWNWQLTDLGGIEKLHAIHSLSLRGCHEMMDISAMSGLTNLRSVDLFRCHALSDIRPLEKLSNLRELDLGYCRNVRDFSPLYALEQLTTLSLPGTVTEATLSQLQTSGATCNLRSLKLRCNGLTEIAITNMPSVTRLEMYGCDEVKRLTLANVPELDEISFGWPHQLEVVELDDSPKQRELVLRQLPTPQDASRK